MQDDSPNLTQIEDPDPWREEPVTGVFQSSWMTVLRDAGWFAVPLLLACGAIGWLDGDTLFITIGVGMAVAWAGLSAAIYLIWGAGSVEITPEALVVARRGGRRVRVRWTDLRDSNYRTGQGSNSWVFRHGNERTVVPERGFSFEDWQQVCRGVRDWKASVPLATAPGVEMERQRPDRAGPPPDGAVFKPRHGAALLVVFPFFGLGVLLGGLGVHEAVRDGAAVGDLLEPMGLLMGSLAFVAVGLWALTRCARRVTFAPDTMLVERVLGSARRIPYGDVTDAWGQIVRTRRGTFNVGRRNADTFHRLLGEHLADDQLSGELMMYRLSEVAAPLAIAAAIVGPVVVAIGLAWGLGFGDGGMTALWLGLTVVSAGTYWLWTRRRARRWIAKAEKEREGPAKPPRQRPLA